MTKRWMFAAIAVVAAVGCIRLGFWQLSRLGERRAANARIETRLAADPVPLPALDAEDPAFRRVEVTGVYDAERPVIEVLRARQGVPGVYVVHPLVLEDGRAVLVERGWVPSADGSTVDSARIAPPAGTVRVSGFVVDRADGEDVSAAGWPVHVRMATPGVLAGALPYDLLPFVVRRDTAAGADRDPLRTISSPDLGEGSHLSYAVQWFAFAAIAVIGSGIFLFRPRGGAVDVPPSRERV